jgi:hypothetical protein
MRTLFEAKNFNTYYYSNIISNVLGRDIELVGFISNFFSAEDAIFELSKPFRKKSAFHIFIESIIREFFINDMHEYDIKNSPHSLYANIALKEFGLKKYSFEDFISDKKKIEYSDVEAYHEELILTGTLEELYEKIASEVFYLLFNNRQALLEFNYIVAEHMDIDLNDIEDNSIKKLYNNNGFLKRVKVPTWCKRAIYFRDRGRCCFCNSDLSGSLSLISQEHFDHIVPLAQGGLNDISNLQLLCSHCNIKKSDNEIRTSNYYESWY